MGEAAISTSLRIRSNPPFGEMEAQSSRSIGMRLQKPVPERDNTALGLPMNLSI